jgi:hypothetical protein
MRRAFLWACCVLSITFAFAIALQAQPRLRSWHDRDDDRDADEHSDEDRDDDSDEDTDEDRDDDSDEDTDEDSDDDIFAPCRPWHASRDRVRRAVLRAEERRSCAATPCLAAVVDDDRRDAVTRSMAALALGEIACHVELVTEGYGRHRRHRLRDVDGLPPVAIASLESATDVAQPATLRQTATRALGRANAVSAIPTLEHLHAIGDPIVRFTAAQSLTRITETDRFDSAFRDEIVEQVLENASTYSITDEVAP